MKKRRIFTAYFEGEVSKKKLKVGRLKKGKLLDDFMLQDEDISQEEVSVKTSSFKYLYVFCLFLFAILFFRLFNLQLVQGEYYYDLSKGNRIRYQIVRAPRGVIYDKNGEALVKNIANFQVIVEPFDFPKDDAEREKLFISLSKDLDIKIDELKKVISSTEENVFLDPKIIKENLDQETAFKIKMKYENYPAVSIESSPTREYLDQNLSHLVGYIGRISEDEYNKSENRYDVNDYIGKNGLEYSYEGYLKGENGKQMVEVDARGRVVRVLGTPEQSESRMGYNVETSLDKGLQEIMVSALSESMKNFNSQAGSVIAINPQNGNILGMVSLPSFDNNLFAEGISQEKYSELLNDPAKPLFNRSISGTYPPGSIIKPVIASAGLEEGIINVNTTIYDEGRLVVKNQYDPSIEYVFKDWKPGGHGTVNVTKAIAESCDTFFYHLGGGYDNFEGLGALRLQKYLGLFGMGNKLEIDLPNEVTGLIPTEEWKKEAKGESWYQADNYHLAIGQGDLLTTPLQAVSFTAAVANGGTLYKPQIVRKVVDQGGTLIKEFLPDVIRKDFISSENINIVRTGMRQTIVSSSGTARSLGSLLFEVAGKTGTAQYGPNNENEHAWFTVFAPYDKPEIALVVLVEGGGEGSSASVPVARKVLEYYFNNR